VSESDGERAAPKRTARLARLAESSPLRGAAAVILALVAVILLWPTEPAQLPRAWLDLIAPLAPGEPIAGDYRLSPPRRGEENDVVFLARHFDGQRVIELHVVTLGQWEGVDETASFGVAFEEPRSSAPAEDLVRVTQALADAVRRNDPGGLGPVTAIPLTRAEPPPKLTLALRKGTGLVGAAAALCLIAAALAMAGLRRGALWLSLATFAVGLALRAAHLDLPFLWDQDVQRIQVGAASLTEILTGAGLQDRRPPLLFLVLHVVQLFGQAEWLVRFPAALAGALAGPAILWLTQRMVGRVSGLSAVAAALVTLSPVLVERSREVSELTLVGLLLLLLASETARVAGKAVVRRSDLIVLAALYALTLWSYYLAIPGVVACVVVAAVTFGLDRKRWLAIGAGVLAGAPSVVLAAQAYLADLSAREAARANPNVAWGDRTIGEVLSAQWQVLVDAVGIGIVALAAVVLVWSLVKKQHLATVSFAIVISVMVGSAALSPFVRVQPYYVVIVIPLMLFALSVVRLEKPRGMVAGAIAAAAAVWFLRGAAPPLGNAYVQETGAFMADFAEAVRLEGSERVATVAHYDATLLSYYLARAEGVTLRSDRLRWSEGTLQVEGLGETIVALLSTHAPNQDPDLVALNRLRDEASRGPVMLVSRSEVRLRELDAFSARCELKRDSAVARLLLCRGADLQPLPPPK
jgi:hypothetical protein